MSQITVTLNIDDDVIVESSGQDNLVDAIQQELGWLSASGIEVADWSFLSLANNNLTLDGVDNVYKVYLHLPDTQSLLFECADLVDALAFCETVSLTRENGHAVSVFNAQGSIFEENYYGHVEVDVDKCITDTEQALVDICLAAKWAGLNVRDVFVNEHTSALLYCFQNNKDLLDFDFWAHYEELLGEHLSWHEYVAIDNAFDGSPFDVEGPNSPEVRTFRNVLSEYRVQRCLGDTENYDYLTQNMSPDALVFLANIIEAYVNDRINVEIVRNNNGQIDFDKSFSLVVNDNQYVPCVATGEVEATAIKWYMGFEDIGSMVDVVQSFVDKHLVSPAVDAVLANASERSVQTKTPYTHNEIDKQLG